MHISESQQSNENTISTKCAKMTDGIKRYGSNGSADGTTPVICKEDTAKTGQGGRLKFFKDGKFILELAHSCDGDKTSWVSVPRKTFWPPSGISTPSYRQESSTSLSDDNSSVQSSPWQRDHSWKQLAPKKGISKAMAFFYCKPRKAKMKVLKEVLCSKNKLLLCNNRKAGRERLSLLKIVRMLTDRLAAGTRAESLISPRKRFLREMENKVQVEDGCLKRSRNKTNGALKESPQRTNGLTKESPRKATNYSITSLLADNRAKETNATSHFRPAYASPVGPSEDIWYSESVDRLRSMELSHVDKRGFVSSYPPQFPCIHYSYPYSLSSFYSPPTFGRGYMPPSMYSMSNYPIAGPDIPSCSWNRSPENIASKDENTSDLPLNLSKHGG